MQGSFAEEMSLTKSEENWVRKRANEPTKGVPSPLGGQKWYDRHAGLVAFGSLVVAVLLLVFAVIPIIEGDIQNHLGPEIATAINDKGLDSLPQQVASLRASMAAMRHDLDLLLQKGLKTSASLPQQSFSRNLDVVADQLRVAAHRNLVVSPEIVRRIRQKLLDIPSSGRSTLYWSAAAQWVTYRSRLNDAERRVIQAESLRPCVAAGPFSMGHITVDANFGCSITLDGRSWDHVSFENAVVIYHGGKVFLRDVTLRNCYFFIDFRGKQPASAGKQLVRQLLASDLSKSNFNITG